MMPAEDNSQQKLKNDDKQGKNLLMIKYFSANG